MHYASGTISWVALALKYNLVHLVFRNIAKSTEQIKWREFFDFQQNVKFNINYKNTILKNVVKLIKNPRNLSKPSISSDELLIGSFGDNAPQSYLNNRFWSLIFINFESI